VDASVGEGRAPVVAFVTERTAPLGSRVGSSAAWWPRLSRVSRSLETADPSLSACPERYREAGLPGSIGTFPDRREA
jgi:hypothetical protein